jgi:hypothetical protein
MQTPSYHHQRFPENCQLAFERCLSRTKSFRLKFLRSCSDSATGMLSICGQCAHLPAAYPWQREGQCSLLLSPSLCLSTIPHAPAGTAGVGMALALHGSRRH